MLSKKVCTRMSLTKKSKRAREIAHVQTCLSRENMAFFGSKYVCEWFLLCVLYILLLYFFLFCVEATDGYETAQRIVKNKFHFSLLLLSLWLNVSKSLFTFCKCMFIKMPNMRQTTHTQHQTADVME